MLYKPAEVTPVGDDRGAQHRRVRQRWRHRAAQPPVARAGLRGQRDRRRLRRRRQPPQVQGVGLHRRPTPVTARATATRSGPSRRKALATWLAGRPDRHRRGTTSSSSVTSTPTRRRTRSSRSRTAGFTNLVETVRRRRRLLLRLRRAVGLPRPRPRVSRRDRSARSPGVDGVPHQRRRAVGPRLQHRLQVAAAGRQPLRAGRVPRLRPRPGRRRPSAELGTARSPRLRRRLGRVRHRQRQPRRDASPTGDAADTHTATVAWGDGTRPPGRRPRHEPAGADAHLRQRRPVHGDGHRHRQPRPPVRRRPRRSPSSTRATRLLAAAQGRRHGEAQLDGAGQGRVHRLRRFRPHRPRPGRHRDEAARPSSRARRPWSRATWQYDLKTVGLPRPAPTRSPSPCRRRARPTPPR